MNCKNCMKRLVWLAGALLVVSLVFPNGFESLGSKQPAAPTAPTGPVVTDPTIVSLLANATPEDRSRINGIYSALAFVLKRPGATDLITTTEQWALAQTNTLNQAVDEPGKYPGLDVAIEAVFARALGTDDVVAVTPEIAQKLVTACETIANSAR